MVLMSRGTDDALQSPADAPAGASAGASADLVVTTKLFAPTRRIPPVVRERLHARLRETLSVRVAVVAAPAGWGKSTLIAEWLRADGPAAGWVSLDRGDDDLTRFWRYVLLGLGNASEGVCSASLRRLGAAGVDVERDLLPLVVNELAACPREVVLVLDDYHVITSAAVHASLASLVERAPRNLHLVLGTRTDPPLPLSRLRVDGELLEIRAEQLRFTPDEAGRLLTHACGLDLTAVEVDRLVARTEGWAAGLQLAALRLADRVGAGERAAFIDRFTGDDRHVIDYLGEEVLATQPEQLREFLLHTSVLNRVCAPLVQAVTGRADAARTLDEAYRANLFLTPLDDEQRWFRYHHLFRGILRHELGRLEPALVPTLHRAAAEWYAQQGDFVEAVGHGIDSGDHELLGELIADGWRREFNSGHLQTVEAWLDALPPGMIARDVRLTEAQVWLALDAGRLDEAGAAIEAAERISPGVAHVQALRALHTFKVGDLGRANALVDALPPRVADPFVLTVRALLLGICAIWRGAPDGAAVALEDASVMAARTGNRLGHTYARGYRALLAVDAGDVARAQSLLGEVDAELHGEGADAHFVAMFPPLARARLALLLGDTDTAVAAARRAVELSRRGAGRIELAAASATLAACLRLAGEHELAAAVRSECRVLLRACADPGPVVLAWFTAEQRAQQQARPADDEPLTERERAVLALLPSPMTQREIADALFVSQNTLKTHLRAVYRKLRVMSRYEAVTRARELGLL